MENEEKHIPGVHDPAGTKTPVNIEDVMTAIGFFSNTPEYVMKAILAVFASTFFERREPVWLMIVGNPSSNKTTLVDLLKGLKTDTYRLDTLTANPFCSGSSEKENPKDLLPLLDGKCFIVKEYSTILGRSDEMVKQLISDLVAIYDGEYTKHSPSRGTISYSSYFSHIGCITPAALQARHRYMSMVGPRFLFLRLPPLTEKERHEGMSQTWNELVNGGRDLKKEAAEVVHQYCLELKNKALNSQTVFFPENIKKMISLIASFTTKGRGTLINDSIESDFDEKGSPIRYQQIDVQIEEPFRVLKQLRKFLKAYVIVNGRSVVEENDLNIIVQIAFSSIPPARANVLDVFKLSQELTISKASNLLEKPLKFVRRQFDDLVGLGLLETQKEENDKAKTYRLKAEFLEILKFKKSGNE